MHRFAPLLLMALVAVPAVAQRANPVAPPSPPPAIDYVETICTGGIDGRWNLTRISDTGRVDRVTRFGSERSSAAPAAVDEIMRALNRAKFETRTVRAYPPRIMDGVNCSLARRKKGQMHRVMIQQEAAGDPAYRDLTAIAARIDAIGRNVVIPRARPAEAR